MQAVLQSPPGLERGEVCIAVRSEGILLEDKLESWKSEVLAEAFTCAVRPFHVGMREAAGFPAQTEPLPATMLGML
jgi:hypothetical protein